MPAFFISRKDIDGNVVTITGELRHHLCKSLRVKPGDTVVLTEEDSRRHSVRILSIDRTTLVALIQQSLPRESVPGPVLHLAQAMLKHDAMDWVIQKGTELGVASVQPVVTRHSVVRPDPRRASAQRLRWQRIAREAAQQSEQWTVPEIFDPLELERWLAHHNDLALRLVLLERRPAPSFSDIPQPPANHALTILVGPEGGWADDEVELIGKAGIQSISLGAHILRAETAALAAISITQSRLGRMGWKASLP